MRRFKSLAAALALVVAGLGVAGAQSEPSLAEVARQKPVKKAKRVITDDDLPRHVPEAFPSQSGAPGSAEDETSSAGSAQDEKTQPAASVGKPNDLEEKLKDARNQADVMRHTEEMQQKGYQQLRERRDSEGNEFRQQILDEELHAAERKMTAMRQRRENAEKQVAEVEAALEKQKKTTQPPQSANGESPQK